MTLVLSVCVLTLPTGPVATTHSREASTVDTNICPALSSHVHASQEDNKRNKGGDALDTNE